MTQIILQDWHLGGIADSKYSGAQNSTYKLVGMDIHGEPGLLKVQQTTKLDTSTIDIIDQKIVAIVTSTTTGHTYLFGKGSPSTVYKRDRDDGTYSEAGDLTNTSNYFNITDAVEFDGDIYMTTQQRVIKWDPTGAWSGRDEDFKTISFDPFHPMMVLENDLYVGNVNTIGKIIPSESSGGAITEGLDLPTDHRVESFGILRSNLIIGTRRIYVGTDDFTGFSRVFNWDLISPSWSSELEVKEFGISAFMDLGGSLLFNAGRKGMLYSYDGVNVKKFRRIPGDWSGKEAIIEKNAVSSYNSILVFGLSNVSGNPTEQGIYSLGGFDPKYPNVFNLEFLPATGSGASTEIGVISLIGNKFSTTPSEVDFIFGYKFSTKEPVNIVDTSNKFSGAYMETQVIDVAREKQKKMKIRICYRTLNGQTITLSRKVNGASSYTSVTLIKHANMNYYESEVDIANANTVQFKVAVTVSSNNAPEIEKIIIDF